MFSTIINTIGEIIMGSGFCNLQWEQFVMILISMVLIYLAVAKGYEPLLLLPIAFGMLLANLPVAGLNSYNEGSLIYYLYQGVKLGIYPPLIFLGIGCMTDFGPLIANPKSFLLGAAAQGGIFLTFIGALALGFTPQEAGSIGIIGGADGPTAIFTTSILAPHLLGSIAVAAYSYMALVPIIQPPIMRALTTKKERSVVMGQLRQVSKLEKIVFPIMVTIVVSFLVPDSAALVGMLMLGNLFKESGAVERLNKTAQNDEHCYHLFGCFCWCYCHLRSLPHPQHPKDHCAGPHRFLLRYCLWRTVWQADVYLQRRKGESVDRFRWCFCCSHGRSCFSEGWTEGSSHQLSADARNGSERCRCNRFCGCSWCSDQHLGLIFLAIDRAERSALFFYSQPKYVCSLKYIFHSSGSRCYW